MPRTSRSKALPDIVSFAKEPLSVRFYEWERITDFKLVIFWSSWRRWRSTGGRGRSRAAPTAATGRRLRNTWYSVPPIYPQTCSWIFSTSSTRTPHYRLDWVNESTSKIGRNQSFCVSFWFHFQEFILVRFLSLKLDDVWKSCHWHIAVLNLLKNFEKNFTGKKEPNRWILATRLL